MDKSSYHVKLNENDILHQLEKVTRKGRQKSGRVSKYKGKRGENWFADTLSDLTGLHFHRIYTSGASVGQSNSDKLEILTQAQGEAQLGDIQSPENLVHYFIWECKNYADIDFHNMLNPGFSKQALKWLDELEYDIKSAMTKMKQNPRPVCGFLCIKITHKGNWIVGNEVYIKKLFFPQTGKIKYKSPVLYFDRQPADYLKNVGFGERYFVTDFITFIENNKKNIFLIDGKYEKRLQYARKMFKKIMHGEVIASDV